MVEDFIDSMTSCPSLRGEGKAVRKVTSRQGTLGTLTG